MRVVAKRLGVVAVLAVALATKSPGVGAAVQDSLTLSVSPAAATDAGFTLTASGNASNPYVLEIHYRAANTGQCGDATSDSGQSISPDGTHVGPGQFSPTGTSTVLPLGDYVVCGWLLDGNNGNATVAGAQLTVHVVAADTLSLNASAGPVEGRAFDVTASGRAYDGNAVIDATYKAAGGACASTPAADTGTVASGSGTGAGAGGAQYSVAVLSGQVLSRGSYLVCAWLFDQNAGVLTSTSTTVAVAPVNASIQLRVAGRADPGQQLPLTLNATLDHDVTVNATVDVVPLHPGTTCAVSPSREPTSVQTVLSTTLTDTQVPSGVVSSQQQSVQAPASGRLLVCAWLRAGWTMLPDPPVVAGPVSTTITVIRNRVFRGNTSQRHRIVVSVAQVQNLVTGITYSDHLRCSGRVTFATGLAWNGLWSNAFDANTFGRLAIGRSGVFRLNLNGNPNHTFKMTGRVSGRQLKGIFSEQGRSFAFTDNSAQNRPCRTGTVRFSATA